MACLQVLLLLCLEVLGKLTAAVARNCIGTLDLLTHGLLSSLGVSNVFSQDALVILGNLQPLNLYLRIAAIVATLLNVLKGEEQKWHYGGNEQPCAGSGHQVTQP